MSQHRSREASCPRGAQAASEGGMVKKVFGPLRGHDTEKWAQGKVSKIAGWNEDVRQLDPLHFYMTLWPPRWGQHAVKQHIIY